MDSTDYILFVPMFFLAIYLWLESQDFGVAIVAPMVAQNEEERKTALNLLKPGLDGNEAWAFLCAGVTGALFRMVGLIFRKAHFGLWGLFLRE